MIDIYHCEISEELIGKRWDRLFSILPDDQKEKNRQFKKWRDRHSHLFGKLLLQKGLVKKGYNKNILHHIQTTFFNKPFLDNTINFNISHSGNFVFCAICEKGAVGIDIEKKDPQLDISQFAAVLSPEEDLYLRNAEIKWAAFYRIWTRKESLIKANGKGLSLPLNQINSLPCEVVIENNTWHIQDIDFNRDYSVSLSSPVKNAVINFCSIDF